MVVSAAALIKWESFSGTAAVATSSHGLEVNTTYDRETPKLLLAENVSAKLNIRKKKHKFCEMKNCFDENNFDNNIYYGSRASKFITKRPPLFSFERFSITLPSSLLLFLRFLLSQKHKKSNKYYYSIQFTSLPDILFFVRYLLLMIFIFGITFVINLLLINLLPCATAAPISIKSSSVERLEKPNLQQQSKIFKENQLIFKLRNNQLKRRLKRRHIPSIVSDVSVDSLMKRIVDYKVFLLFFDQSLLNVKNKKMNELKNWLDLAIVSFYITNTQKLSIN